MMARRSSTRARNITGRTSRISVIACCLFVAFSFATVLQQPPALSTTETARGLTVRNSTQEKITTTSSTQGSNGGGWTWCTHVVQYGLNFDLGLASFLAWQLQPSSSIEFGCGVGLYSDYLVRYGNVGQAFGLEPEDMSPAGVFVPGQQPVKIMGNTLENPKVRDELPIVDLVYSIEVAEHVPRELHPALVEFLVSKTKKYLVFSAALPGQGGTGHIAEKPRQEWIDAFEQAGLVLLPQLTDMLLKQCDPKNANHKRNPIVFGRSLGLDTSVRSPLLQQTPSRAMAKTIEKALFPHVVAAIDASQCTA